MKHLKSYYLMSALFVLGTVAAPAYAKISLAGGAKAITPALNLTTDTLLLVGQMEGLVSKLKQEFKELKGAPKERKMEIVISVLASLAVLIQYFETTFGHVSNIVVAFDKDQQQKLTKINQGMKEVTGQIKELPTVLQSLFILLQATQATSEEQEASEEEEV